MPFGVLTWVGPSNHVLHKGQNIQGEWAILGVVQPTEKHCESLLRCTLHKTNDGIKAPLLQRTALLPTARCRIALLSVKNPPLKCGFLSKVMDN